MVSGATCKWHSWMSGCLRVILCIFRAILTNRGHRTSPISLKFGMQFCFRVLTTKWILKSFNFFYFWNYREGRFGVTLAARQYGGRKVVLLLQHRGCYHRFSIILVIDIKNYLSSVHLSKYIWEMLSLKY